MTVFQIFSGLTDQMLSLVMMQERPDLEETRSALVVSNAQMQRELKEIEDRILQRLSASKGSAVDDIDLVQTLDASSIKSEEIKVFLSLNQYYELIVFSFFYFLFLIDSFI